MAETLGNAGYVVTGSGGGGVNGDYMFANLVELDSLITEWTEIRDAIQLDGDKLAQAQQTIFSPAEDHMSSDQFQALFESLDKAQIHNGAMIAYADSYLAKLTSARVRYVADEESNIARMRGVHEV